MGSDVLDAAAASETAIMEDSGGLCKAPRHPFRSIRYSAPQKLAPADGRLGRGDFRIGCGDRI